MTGTVPRPTRGDQPAASGAIAPRALRAYAEQVGRLCEQAGLPRAAGRLLGWLLVADPPEQSAAGLRAALRASAGSVSTTARLLIDLGLVERIKVEGDRRAYYRMRPGGWTRFLRERTATVRATREVAAQGLALLADAPEERRRRLREMHDLYAWWEREALALLERWTQQDAR